MVLAMVNYNGIAIVLLVVVGMVVLGFALLPVWRLFCRMLSGWNALVQQFPPTEVHKTGEKYQVPGDCFMWKKGRGGMASYSPYLIESLVGDS